MKLVKHKLLLLLLLCSCIGYSQTTYYELNTTIKKKYYSYKSNRSLGISKRNSAGTISVMMYYKPKFIVNNSSYGSTTDNKESLLYGVYNDANAAYNHQMYYSYWSNTFSKDDICDKSKLVYDKKNCEYLRNNSYKTTTIYSSHYSNRIENAANFEDSANQLNTLGKNKDVAIPVKIILKIENTNIDNLEGINLPGYNKTLTKDDFKNVNPILYAINDGDTHSFYTNSTDGTNNLTLKMGDKITFKVLKSYVNNSTSNISIANLPGVWVARFAWDCMYYFTQSVQPGDFKPFIPFDAVVHSIMFKRFADYFKPDGTTPNKTNPGYKINEDDWADDGIYYTWSYTVPARMDKTKSIYTPVINWKLYKPVSNYYQRDDQRRGLNMAMLNKWSMNNNSYSPVFLSSGIDPNANFGSYNGYNYELGADTDELQYLGQVSKSATGTLPSSTQITALNLTPSTGGDDTWKVLMPQERLQTSETSTAGYTKSTDYKDNLALSYMVTAYQRNRNSVYGKGRTINPYQGFEIEDQGLIVKSDGTTACDGSSDCYYYQKNNSYTPNQLPGQIIFTLNGSTVININIDASAPVATDNGFYGSLHGTSWPSYYEESVPYTFDGLKNLSDAELKKFSMVMEYEDGNGFLIKTDRALTNTDKLKIAKDNGTWTENFKIEKFGHYNLSVYYTRNSGADPVIVAGKEISPINLRFLAVNTSTSATGYDGARGDGYTWYKQDYYDNYANAIPKYGWYLGGKKPSISGAEYLREYAFTKGETVNFSIMDSDPHTFRPTGTEYYKSNRAKAHRIPTDSLSTSLYGNKKGYLQWSIKNATLSDQGINEGSTVNTSYGISSSYTFGTTGLFVVEAKYRGVSSVKHIIRIVNYNYTNKTSTDKKGEIKVYDLSPDQKNWLKINANDDTYKVLSVENVLSKFAYIDGVKDAKTYDKYNNYSDVYSWQTISSINNTSLSISNDQNNITNVLNFNWTSNTPPVSIEQSVGYPINWFRHAPSYADITDVDKNTNVNWVTAAKYWQIPLSPAPSAIGTKLDGIKNTVFEPWNLTLPWIATTTRHGYRLRANIKCFYSAKDIFDNDHGAFTGRNQAWSNGNGTDINSLSATAYSDGQNTAAFNLNNQDKAREAFYHDLVNNRKLIVKLSDYSHSNSKTFTVKQVDNIGYFITSLTISTNAPSKPVLTATAVSNGNSTLSWTITDDSSNPVSYFKVYKSDDLQNSVATLPGDARECTLNNLCDNASNIYQVIAYNASGTAGQSSNNYTLGMTAPILDDSFNSPSKTSKTIRLAWNAVTQTACPDKIEYKIEVYSPGTFVSWNLLTTRTTTNTYTEFNNLSAATDYKFILTAYDTKSGLGSNYKTLYVTTNSSGNAMEAVNELNNLQLGETGFMLYPNPVTGNEIKVNAVADRAPFSIRNTLGQVVLKGNVNAGSISIATLSAGTYFLEVSSNGEPIVAKFIKN